MFARLGGILAPQLALSLPSLTFPSLHLIIFAAASLLGGAAAACLPETVGQPLPDSFSQERTRTSMTS